MVGHLGCFQSAVLELSAFEQHLDVVDEAQGSVRSLRDRILLCAGPCAEQEVLTGLRFSVYCWRSQSRVGGAEQTQGGVGVTGLDSGEPRAEGGPVQGRSGVPHGRGASS